MKYLVFILFFFPAIKGKPQTVKQPVLVTDMLKMKTVNNVTLTKDGSMAAFVVTSIEPESDSAKWEYKYVNQIWMIATESGATPRQLTFSKEGASQPAWSPDGRQLAFVRTVEGKSQIFVLSLSGGEPMQLTKSKYGAVAPRWSPDSKQVVFSSPLKLKDVMNDSLVNPGKKVPEWSLEKPGFAANEQLINSPAKPNPDGSINEVRAYLEMNANDKRRRCWINSIFKMKPTSLMS